MTPDVFICSVVGTGVPGAQKNPCLLSLCRHRGVQFTYVCHDSETSLPGTEGLLWFFPCIFTEESTGNVLGTHGHGEVRSTRSSESLITSTPNTSCYQDPVGKRYRVQVTSVGGFSPPTD